MRAVLFILIALIGVSVSAAALAAQKDCASIRQKSGGGAEQKCLYENEEDTIKQQIAQYKAMLDAHRETVKTSYESRINHGNFLWKESDLTLQRDEARYKELADRLGTDKERSEEQQAARNSLARIKKLRSLTATVHGNAIRRLQKLKEMELLDLDQALATYELQLRLQRGSE